MTAPPAISSSSRVAVKWHSMQVIFPAFVSTGSGIWIAAARVALGRGGDAERPDRALHLDHVGDLLADVADAGGAVELGDARRGADEEPQPAGLGAEVALAVDAREEVGDVARVLPLAVQEDPLVGHEDVVEDGERLGELVVRGDRRLPLAVAAGVEGAGDHRDPRRVDRDRERDRVVGVRLAHRARGDHDQLLRADRARRVRLGPAHDDAVGCCARRRAGTCRGRPARPGACCDRP